MLGLFGWATAVVLYGLLVPSALQAQYPRARRGQFEVRGFDFGRQGAWRIRAAAVRTARHRLLRDGAISRLNGASALTPYGSKVAGRMMVPVVPLAFRNVPAPYPVSQYQELFFDPRPVGRPYSLRSFYQQLSNQNITVDGRVLDWVTADSNDTYYEDGCNGIGVLAPCPPRTVNRFGGLLLKTVDLLSRGPGGINLWSDFDNDGPDGQPNSGDDDGVVDFVAFLQPERDGSCPGSTNIWAHRFVLRAWNGGSPYVTRTPWTGHPGEFLKVDSYIIQSAVGGGTACDPQAIMPIGTLAHETGHAFGLPDLYDTDLSNPQVSQGVGEWGLMGSGNFARPYSPARFEAWSLAELGWVTVDTLSSGREIWLGPVTQSDTVLYVPVPGTDEYYLLENRQALESDSAQMNPAFGARQKSPGLLIWHIDQSQVDQHGFAFDNRVNSGPVHGVALVQADGRNDLRTPGGGNRGDVGDSYPGSSGNASLCRSTAPPAVDNHGGFAWFCLTSITQHPSGPVSFGYLSFHSVFASDHAGARIRVNGSKVVRLDRFFPPGSSTELSIDSVQEDSARRTRFDFLSWSDAGERTHIVTARDTPDTVTARVSVEHRLRAIVQGAAAAAIRTETGLPVSGDLFLSEGSRLSLVAQPQPGAVFAGWGGDTTWSGDTLTVVVAHPYDLTAKYLSIRDVALDQAADGILGATSLANEDVQYLDAAGNRNGIYDLGDFLAAVDRSQAEAEIETHALSGR